MARTQRKTDYSNHPYVANYPELRDWLRKNEARCMWQLPMGPPNPYPNAYVECYQIPTNGRTFIVIVHAEKHGWDIYTGCGNIEVTATLNDADARLGLS